MNGPDETTLAGRRFCIQPYVDGIGGGVVFKVVPELCTPSYLMLEVIEDSTVGAQFRLGRHLVTSYRDAGPPDREARYDGTLVVQHACRITDGGFIEPSGERREL